MASETSARQGWVMLMCLSADHHAKDSWNREARRNV